MKSARFETDSNESQWTVFDGILLLAIVLTLERHLRDNLEPWKAVYQYLWNRIRGRILSDLNDLLRALVRGR